MEKKYQIFISSTYKDLIEARSKVRDAILSMMHFPVGMEMFNAADEEQWEIIQETIDSSDYYVLILGQRYGSVIESGSDAGISYTEKEFRYAREKKIPILVFIIDDDVAIKPEFMEKDPESIKKLADFKTEAKKGRTVQWWTNIDELAREVSESLHQQMDRKKRPGWIRGDAFDIEASHAEILSLNKKMEYILIGDYYLPALKVPRTRPVGRWGMLHKAYLKLRKPAYYQSLLLNGKLDAVLADVEGQAAERYEVLIEQMSQRESISEKLKEENQMEWVRRMRNLENRAEEIVKAELICTFERR